MGPDATGEKTSLVNQLQQGVKKTTDAAVAEGHHDVDAAKATGASYVDQAKALASSALATAQVGLSKTYRSFVRTNILSRHIFLKASAIHNLELPQHPTSSPLSKPVQVLR